MCVVCAHDVLIGMCVLFVLTMCLLACGAASSQQESLPGAPAVVGTGVDTAALEATLEAKAQENGRLQRRVTHLEQEVPPTCEHDLVLPATSMDADTDNCVCVYVAVRALCVNAPTPVVDVTAGATPVASCRMCRAV